MKKILILCSFFLLLFAPAMQGAEKELRLTEDQKVRVGQLEARVLEIRSMDRSHLTFKERRALRKELYEIRREMKGFTSGGVYLSVAAIVIIILVLILII